MPNVGAVLKEEIRRLSRREMRRELGGIRKISTKARGHIAALRRQIANLQREFSELRRRVLERKAEASTPTDAAVRTRFVARGLRSHRARVELSAEDYGRLVGVSAQTIYNWERKMSTPSVAQRASLAAVRALGKREVLARLGAVPSRRGNRARRRQR